MSSYNCQYCNNEYSNNKSLKFHQKTTKFCIKIQKEFKNKPSDNETQNNETENNENENNEYVCIHCNYTTTLKASLLIHNERCKIRLHKIKEENDQKKDELIKKLQNELHILMTQTYPDRENKWKEELSYYKTEVRIKDEQIKIKDEIILKFEKEIETLKNKVDTTYNTIIEKGEKRYTELVCTNSKFLESKISNQTLNYTVNNNYGIKPLTPESVISAFDSYNTKYENAFVAYTYDFDGLMKIPNLENVLYGIAKELRDYYGITDKSREKITYNNNGDIQMYSWRISAGQQTLGTGN
jgi:vacuolar-type H+-ATPase subunit I/STV1